ncbi:ATP synthase subunit I [Ferruginibacter sp.]|uniref:ATP synthase subunit I n=1 Tax=Ferruginibacter sp. TaxID=1940288 RepID=UPI0019923223|nr:ATP synthase subunit I [Ferruginibacter sp.]MBC7628733.1 ATP synthase subunit I [Ferruginibacter sp.]
MNEISNLIWAFIVGLLLGVLFFGGLWITVKKIINSKTPGLLMVGSFVLRITIVLAGFYFIGLGDWKKLIACLIGFMVSRFTVIYLTKSVDEKNAQIKKEVVHEA